jgi:TIR domain
MEITDEFLSKVESHLRALPSPIPGQSRGASWMTAHELAEFFGLEEASEELESALLARWEAGASGKVRPAKYPHETDLFRLWGHEDVVGVRDRSEIEPRRLGSSDRLEPLDLPADAPAVFLSFSSHDLALATELRLYLGKLNIRTWMYQAVPSRELILESVRAAVERCRAVIVLLTCSSLGSAWVYSEVHMASEAINKKIW